MSRCETVTIEVSRKDADRFAAIASELVKLRKRVQAYQVENVTLRNDSVGFEKEITRYRAFVDELKEFMGDGPITRPRWFNTMLRKHGLDGE